MKAGRQREDGGAHRRGRKPADLGRDVPPGHIHLADGSPGLASGLVKTPNWWPFSYTTADNLKRLKRRRAVLKVQQWVRWPEALL